MAEPKLTVTFNEGGVTVGVHMVSGKQMVLAVETLKQKIENDSGVAYELLVNEVGIESIESED